MVYKCFFDGCCEPKNPGGNMGFGAIIYRDGIEFIKLSSFVKQSPNNSNNVAEYQSFGWVVKNLVDVITVNDDIEIFGDSKLVVEQMNGNWQIKSGLYSQYAFRAKNIVSELKRKSKSLKIQWIPRLQNEVADDLSKTPMLKANIKFKLQKS